ncbi:hypothetical protein B0H13DRAFT_1893574 [Mycena leptocephala]|nr:hypothetical protein B0H13DRAFT_1893574 [Mycena leptocephala]
MAQHAAAVDEKGKAQQRTEGQSESVIRRKIYAHIGGGTSSLRRKLDGDFGKTIHQTTQRQSASVYKYERRRILDPGRRGNDNASNKVASEQRTPADFEANDNGHDGGKEEQTEQTVRPNAFEPTITVSRLWRLLLSPTIWAPIIAHPTALRSVCPLLVYQRFCLPPNPTANHGPRTKTRLGGVRAAAKAGDALDQVLTSPRRLHMHAPHVAGSNMEGLKGFALCGQRASFCPILVDLTQRRVLVGSRKLESRRN